MRSERERKGREGNGEGRGRRWEGVRRNNVKGRDGRNTLA